TEMMREAGKWAGRQTGRKDEDAPGMIHTHVPPPSLHHIIREVYPRFLCAEAPAAQDTDAAAHTSLIPSLRPIRTTPPVMSSHRPSHARKHLSAPSPRTSLGLARRRGAWASLRVVAPHHRPPLMRVPGSLRYVISATCPPIPPVATAGRLLHRGWGTQWCSRLMTRWWECHLYDGGGAGRQDH
ncbi:hypothetical protein DFH09DRAFT_1124737, partial [Mycena vulgaris]